MSHRLLCAVLLLLAGVAQADGFWANGYCYATIEEAATRAAYHWNGYGNCADGNCRILAYVPTSGSTQVLNGSQVISVTISPCAGAISVLPSNLIKTPWFGSDPGIVSACGNTVASTGGLTGSSGSGSGSVSGVTALTPEQALERYNDGVALGWGVALATIAAFGVAVLGKAVFL